MVKVSFNSKSKAVAIPVALKMAEKLGGTFTGNIISVEGEKLDESIIKLIGKVAGLSHSELEINGEEIIDMGQVWSIAKCEKIKKCNGDCSFDYPFYKWSAILGSLKIIKHPFSAESFLYAFHDLDAVGLIKEEGINFIDISRDVLANTYQEMHSTISKICPLYKDRILKAIQAFPEYIHLEFTEVPDEKDFSADDQDDELWRQEEAERRRLLVMEIADEVELRIKKLLGK